MPPMQPQPPAPRPLQPFRQNNGGNMQNTGWRDAYMSPMGNNYRDDPRPTLPGFYISSPMNISARDVPMDGSISFFPAEDLSYIIIKQWSGNGMISEARYVPVQAQEMQQNTQQSQNNNNDTPDTDDAQNQSQNQNSEIVEVISAALNEQTQRLTAAFSQIGVAFSTLQQKLDAITPVSTPNPGPVSNMSLPDQPLAPPIGFTETDNENTGKARRQRKSDKE